MHIQKLILTGKTDGTFLPLKSSQLIETYLESVQMTVKDDLRKFRRWVLRLKGVKFSSMKTKLIKLMQQECRNLIAGGRQSVGWVC